MFLPKICQMSSSGIIEFQFSFILYPIGLRRSQREDRRTTSVQNTPTSTLSEDTNCLQATYQQSCTHARFNARASRAGAVQRRSGELISYRRADQLSAKKSLLAGCHRKSLRVHSWEPEETTRDAAERASTTTRRAPSRVEVG